MLEIPGVEENVEEMQIQYFDYSIVQNVMKHMCVKKAWYDSPFLTLAPNARDMMFDELVPLRDLPEMNTFEIVATRDLDDRLKSKGLLTGTAKRRSTLRDLAKLWDAESKLRAELELLRKDERFLCNGFYMGIRRVMNLDSVQGKKIEGPFVPRDMERVAARLEFFASEMARDKEKIELQGPMVLLQPFINAMAEELGRFGVGFRTDGVPLNRPNKNSEAVSTVERSKDNR